MANNNINVGVNLKADAKQLKAALDQSVSGVTKLNSQLNNLTKTFDSMTTGLMRQATALQKQTAAAKEATKAGKQQYVTQNQLIKQQRVIDGLFMKDSRVAQKMYTSSWHGMSEALRLFNDEAKTTIIQQKGVIKTLADSDQAYTRFMMKGNIVARTLQNMSTQAINLGKNLQWTGRQMMVGITMPLLGAGAAVGKTYLDWDRAVVKNQKLLNGTTKEIKAQSKELEKFAKDTAVTLGINPTEMVKVQNVFSAIRADVETINKLSGLSAEFNIVGDLQDMGQAAEVVRMVWQNTGKQGAAAIADTRKQLEIFNVIEDNTNLNMKDLAQAIPIVAGTFNRLKMSAGEGAAFLAAITQQTGKATEAAHAMNTAFTKMPAAMALLASGQEPRRLRALRDEIAKFNAANPEKAMQIFDQSGKQVVGGSQMIMQIARAWETMSEAQRSVFSQYAFGATTVEELDPLMRNVSKSLRDGGDDFAKAMSAAMDSSSKAGDRWSEQIKTFTGSDSGKIDKFVAQLRVTALELGNTFVDNVLPVLTGFGKWLQSAVGWFKSLDKGTREWIVKLALLAAAVGPITYAGGQMILLFSQLAKFTLINPIKAFFNIFHGQRRAIASTQEMQAAVNALTDEFHKTNDVGKFVNGLQTLKDQQNSLATATNNATNAAARQRGVFGALGARLNRGFGPKTNMGSIDRTPTPVDPTNLSWDEWQKSNPSFAAHHLARVRHRIIGRDEAMRDLSRRGAVTVGSSAIANPHRVAGLEARAARLELQSRSTATEARLADEAILEAKKFRPGARKPAIRSVIRKNISASMSRTGSIMGAGAKATAEAERMKFLWDTYAPMLVNNNALTAKELQDGKLMKRLLNRMDREVGPAATPEAIQNFMRKHLAAKTSFPTTTDLARDSVSTVLGPQKGRRGLPILPGELKDAFALGHIEGGTMDNNPEQRKRRREAEKQMKSDIAEYKKTGKLPAKNSAAERYIRVLRQDERALLKIEEAIAKKEAQIRDKRIGGESPDEAIKELYDLNRRRKYFRGKSAKGGDAIQAFLNKDVNDGLRSAFDTQLRAGGVDEKTISKGMPAMLKQLGLAGPKGRIGVGKKLAEAIRDKGAHILEQEGALPKEFWDIVGMRVHGGVSKRQALEMLKKRLGPTAASKDIAVIREAIEDTTKAYAGRLGIDLPTLTEQMKTSRVKTQDTTETTRGVASVAERDAALKELDAQRSLAAAKIADVDKETTRLLAEQEKRIDAAADKEVAKRRGIEDKRVADEKARNDAEIAKLRSTAAQLRSEQARMDAERQRALRELSDIKGKTRRAYLDETGKELTDDELDTMVTARQAEMQRKHDDDRKMLAAKNLNRSNTKIRQMVENSVIGAEDTKVKQKVAESLRGRRKKDMAKFWMTGGLMGNAYGDVSDDELETRALMAMDGMDIDDKSVRREMGKKSLGDRAKSAGQRVKGAGRGRSPIKALGRAARGAPRVGYNAAAALAPGAVFSKAADGVGKFGKVLGGAGGKMGAFKGVLGGMMPMVDMFTMGMGSAAMAVSGPLATGLMALGPLVPIITLVAGAVLLIWKNWDKVKKGIGGGLDALKSAFGAIKDAVIQPFMAVFDRLAGEGSRMSNTWTSVGKILNVVFHGAAIALRVVAAVLRPIMTMLAEVMSILIQTGQFVVAVFTGQWSDAFKAIRGIVASAAKFILIILTTPIKLVLKAISKLANISIFGKKLVPSSVRKAIEGAADFVGDLPEKLRKTLAGAEGKRKAKKGGEEQRKALEEGLNEGGPVEAPGLDTGQAEEDAKAAAEALRDEFQNQLRSIVDGWKEAALDAFESVAEARKEAIEQEIKALDDLDKAEEKLQREREYRAKRQELLDDRVQENIQYTLDHANAISEGRFDDARVITLEHNKNINEINKNIVDTDADYQKDLAKDQREAQKQSLNDKKEALDKELDVQKDNLQKQLDAITEFIPRNAAAAKAMQEKILATLGQYGVSYADIGKSNAEAWGMGMSDAMSKARAVLAEQAYWAGDDVLTQFAAGLGVPKDQVKDQGPAPDFNAIRQAQGAADLFGGLSIPNAEEQRAGAVAHFGGLRYHKGGWVGGMGDVPATLQAGEFVMRRDAVNRLGRQALEDLNGGRTYHEGGFVNALGRGITNAKNNLLSGGSFGKMSAEDLKNTYALRYLARNPLVQAITGGGGGSAAPGEHLISALANFLVGNFPGSRISSLFRPGAITATGNRSLHGMGRAVDISGSRGIMKSIFDYVLANVGRFNINELIFEHQIWKNGRGLYRFGRDDHMDHVHLGINGAVNSEALKQLKVGGDVLRNGPAYLHAGERVLTAPLTEKLDRMLEGGGVTIHVDNFIGQPEWFKAMMKEYDITVVPAKARQYGRENRTISSYGGK